jgi:hypothetical protein
MSSMYLCGGVSFNAINTGGTRPAGGIASPSSGHRGKLGKWGRCGVVVELEDLRRGRVEVGRRLGDELPGDRHGVVVGRGEGGAAAAGCTVVAVVAVVAGRSGRGEGKGREGLGRLTFDRAPLGGVRFPPHNALKARQGLRRLGVNLTARQRFLRQGFIRSRDGRRAPLAARRAPGLVPFWPGMCYHGLRGPLTDCANLGPSRRASCVRRRPARVAQAPRRADRVWQRRHRRPREGPCAGHVLA